MNKVTIAQGNRWYLLCNDTIKPAVESANASLIGVALTCTATESSRSNFCDYVIEAEFENERDMTLFLLGDIHSAQADLDKHLRGPWRVATFAPRLIDLLLQIFSK